MSIIESSPQALSVETPAILAQGTNTQANTTCRSHRGPVVEGTTTLTLRSYVAKVIQNVIKPAIKTFLETCDTNPRIAALAATPALIGFLLILVFFTISALFMVFWTILMITFDIICVIVVRAVSLFFKLVLLSLATLPLAAIATALLVGANMVSQSIISRIPQNGTVVTQTVREIDWKSVMEQLINFGKNLGPGSAAAALERLVVLTAALHNFFVTFKSGMEDLNNAKADEKNLSDRDPPTDFTAETSVETEPREF